MPEHMPRMTWMQGTGNRFVLVDQSDLGDWDPAALAIQLARSSGQSDGLLLLNQVPGGADVEMAIINADGSSAEMCGNGLRCVAYDMTRRGHFTGKTIRVRIGSHTLAARVIPTKNGEAMVCTRMPIAQVMPGSDLMRVELGNSHGVLLYDSLPTSSAWSEQVHALHQDGLHDLNLHAVHILDNATLEMQSWERGVGPTQACASGATAAVSALASKGLIRNIALVHQPGGVLRVHWRGPEREPTNIGTVGDVSLPTDTSDPATISMGHKASSQ
ncbi:MAG: diaminopimelate epimerase [Planctomycetota bacterium]|nr:diaminopimelate epimerase [Planctomycetota bacterium]